ncbi:MAG: hypothetical protein JSU05_01550 [Bacteroidetes bacterium]|nr:hypothetical protein [Bacteroidota bacterium]
MLFLMEFFEIWEVSVEKGQATKIGYIEDVVYRMGYIDKMQIFVIADALSKSGYGEYFMRFVKFE